MDRLLMPKALEVCIAIEDDLRTRKTDQDEARRMTEIVATSSPSS
jgi:hypothetical protein